VTATAQPVDFERTTEVSGCLVLVDKWFTPAAKSVVWSTVLGTCCAGFAVWEHGWAFGAEVGTKVAFIGTIVALTTAYAGPPVLDRFKLPPREPQVVDADPPMPRTRLRRDPIVRTSGQPRPPANDGRGKMAELRERLTAKAPRRRHYERQAEPVQAVRSDWDVVEFYDVLEAIWPGDPTQDAFRQRWGQKGGRDLYTVYVGKKNSDVTCWGDVGIWRQWRVIQQVDRRGKCDWAPWVQDITDVLRLNSRLRAYAARQGWRL